MQKFKARKGHGVKNQELTPHLIAIGLSFPLVLALWLYWLGTQTMPFWPPIIFFYTGCLYHRYILAKL
jgi:hypothetical protein